MLAKVFSQEPTTFKANNTLYSNAFQYFGAIDDCKYTDYLISR